MHELHEVLDRARWVQISPLGRGGAMGTLTCPICQQPHARSVDCHGTPIDWSARKQRALTWRRAQAALPVAKRTPYPWEGEPS